MGLVVQIERWSMAAAIALATEAIRAKRTRYYQVNWSRWQDKDKSDNRRFLGLVCRYKKGA